LSLLIPLPIEALFFSIHFPRPPSLSFAYRTQSHVFFSILLSEAAEWPALTASRVQKKKYQHMLVSPFNS